MLLNFYFWLNSFKPFSHAKNTHNRLKSTANFFLMIWNNFTSAFQRFSHTRISTSICFYVHFHSDSEITATPILDNPHLILLFYLTQLFLRELVRSYHLLKIIPMDMSGYFGKHIKTEMWKFPMLMRENNWINFSLHFPHNRLVCSRSK